MEDNKVVLVTRQWLRDNESEEAARFLLKAADIPWLTEITLNDEMDIIYRSEDNDERLTQLLCPAPQSYLMKKDRR